MAVGATPPTQQRPEAGRLEALMERYQRGDSNAGDEMVDCLSTQMFRFFLAQARNRSDAEDLLQDLWLRIHNARSTYRRGEPLLPWMYAIAHRVRIDHYRRSRRVVAHEVSDEGAMQSAAQGQPSAPPDITELLKELPDSQREVVLLMKVSGLTLEEVARATGTTAGAVKQKAHRAYGKLRQLLGGESLEKQR